MQDYEFHELAGMFSLMEGPEFQSFVEDIRANGQRERIWTYKEKIIDGRNRYNACKELGVEPEYREWEGDEEDLLDFILSANLHRRQLNQSQRALLGARLLPKFEDKAKKRQGSRTDISANLRESEKRKSSADVAALVVASSRLIETAKKVLADGIPELVQQVEAGHMSLNEANRICKEPPEEQAILLSLTKKERSERLRKSPVVKNISGKFKKAVTSVRAIIDSAKADGWSQISRSEVEGLVEDLQAALGTSEDRASTESQQEEIEAAVATPATETSSENLPPAELSQAQDTEVEPPVSGIPVASKSKSRSTRKRNSAKPAPVNKTTHQDIVTSVAKVAALDEKNAEEPEAFCPTASESHFDDQDPYDLAISETLPSIEDPQQHENGAAEPTKAMETGSEDLTHLNVFESQEIEVVPQGIVGTVVSESCFAVPALVEETTPEETVSSISEITSSGDGEGEDSSPLTEILSRVVGEGSLESDESVSTAVDEAEENISSTEIPISMAAEDYPESQEHDDGTVEDLPSCFGQVTKNWSNCNGCQHFRKCSEKSFAFKPAGILLRDAV